MMDPFLARTMVEALSEGINPVTGQALSQHDSCSDEEIRWALQTVLEHCTIAPVEQCDLFDEDDPQTARKKRAAKNAQRYPRGGEVWSAKEEKELVTMLRRGKNIYQIANALKRTPRAISERMKNLQCAPVKGSKKKENQE